MSWPWGYSAFDVIVFELAHFTFSFCAVLLAVSPVAFWISTTYRAYSDGTRPYYSNTEFPQISTKVVFFMVLLSLSAGLVAHVLEDIFIGWF